MLQAKWRLRLWVKRTPGWRDKEQMIGLDKGLEALFWMLLPYFFWVGLVIVVGVMVVIAARGK